MRYLLLLMGLALGVSSHADNCYFNLGQPSDAGNAIQCGMTKTAVLNRLGQPLFLEDKAAALNAVSQPAEYIKENWVDRLKDSQGTQKMVAVKLVGGNVAQIIVSQ